MNVCVKPASKKPSGEQNEGKILGLGWMDGRMDWPGLLNELVHQWTDAWFDVWASGSIAFFNAYISCTHPPIQHPTSNIQHPTFNIQHPTCNIQHSTFNIQLPLMTECFWRAHRCISKFLHVIFEELFARLDECTDGCMDGWMYGWVDGWMHGRMDVWIAGCMDG